MVRVMVRLPGRVRVRGCGPAWIPGARRGRAAGRAASREAGRRRSRTRDGRVANDRGMAGHMVRVSRASPHLAAAGGPATWSLARLETGFRACLARGEGAAAGLGLVALGGAGISCLINLG